MADSKPTHPENEIRALIEARLDAMRAKDTARVMALGADDFTHFSLAPPLIDRGDASDLTRWFASWEGQLAFEMRELVITAGADVAFAHGLLRMRGTQGGKATDLWLRQTLGFRRAGGDWKLVHEHESVPFYMDGSYRAALDLKP